MKVEVDDVGRGALVFPEPERTGSEVDVDRPNSARMYDYYLGGSTNFAVDREAAEAGLTAMPYARDYAVANRAFLRRAVSYLVRQGIDQFVDLGSGIPTKGNVHEIAHQHNPQARIAYVDHEPVAVAHARALLGENPMVSIDEADIRDPEAVLSANGVAKLDFGRPVAVLAVAILPFVPDQAEATALTATYRDACAPGSYLAVTHISQFAATDEQVAAAEEVMARTPTPVRWRPPEEIAELLDGYELVPPGLVPTPSWHPDQQPSADDIARANAYAAVGHRV
ncbi:SAM-dependent methyltransferase [Saccharopolyspora mangrovi]|uniref:SAM-dependent methyltransferase n=1 Tax=Saccharopolyspora mangrovi TaxID=3082379 RepID=A0ABU6AKT6_9PSEU|nr:SAM-dependent methyltransferase [Saccharopolyspora sp. S2-29]MEB3372173.1 SAM-dependent methyltransferase [Saccharopolyspora sp. S2-29]